MALSGGMRLGPYEILSAIGAGGMGEVYRATDTTLGRQVAIKVLPDAFARDAERLARFEREAKTLAALNHPHIAQIYGLEKSSGVQALVMELVEGEDLSQCIARGAIPLDEALPIAKQIAEALEAAHEQGIIHRDLKPANIKVRSDGTVKVLDFGLAKLHEPNDSNVPNVLSMSPTITSPVMMTGAGVLLGTSSYMAPEQARGKIVDRRCDVWAFGCVLYEMLTGRRAFEGEDVTETIAAVIYKEPAWTALPPATLPAVRITLQRCLEKDRAKRLRDIGDARLALDGAFESREAPAAKPATRSWRRTAAGVAAIGATAAGASFATWLLSTPHAVPPAPIRFELQAPEGNAFATSGFELSPDGRYLAFMARNSEGLQLLWLHDFDTGESRPLSRTLEVGNVPIWAPDSRHLMVFGDAKMRKMDLNGGPSQTFCEGVACASSLGSWNTRDVVIVGHSTTVVTRLDPSGGPPAPLTVLDAARQERGHTGPRFLPDGEHFLYTRISRDPEKSGIFVGSLNVKPDQQDMRMLAQTPLSVGYVPSADPRAGYVLYMREGTLFARAFDNQMLRFTGEATPVAEEIGDNGNVTGYFSASVAGTLVIRHGGQLDGEVVWVDRGGHESGSLNAGVLKQPEFPRLSPDGRHVALTIARDVWVYDIGGRPPIKLTFDGKHFTPLWTLDGRRIVYEGAPGLLSVPADGSEATPAPASPAGHYHPYGWSSDGQSIVAVRLDGSGSDVVTIPVQPPGPPRAVVATRAQEGVEGTALSPDRRWLAYASNTTGRLEIWVQPFPGPGAPVRISPDGGTEPVWSRNGKELFYLTGNTMMAVAVDTSTGFTFRPPTTLFQNKYVVMSQPPSYDVGTDGRFLMVKGNADSTAKRPMQVTINWLQSLNTPPVR